MVLEIQDADQLPLFQEREAENGTAAVPTDVFVAREEIVGRGVVEDDAVPCSHDVPKDRFGKLRRRRRRLAEPHLDRVVVGRGFRLDAVPVAAGKDEKTSRRSGVLDGHRHQPVDQPIEHDFHGDCLRGFHDGGEIQQLDRRRRRRGSTGARRLLAQERVGLFELPHLRGRAPAKIAVPGVPKIGVRDRLEAALGVETGGQLVCEGLVLDEAVLARQADGVFVQTLRVEMPPLDPRELGQDERKPVAIILGAVVGP